jgi:hypothetical protein
LSLDSRSRTVTLTTAAAAALVFGAFAWTLHPRYEIRETGIEPFASRYSQEDLDAARRDRAERWRNDPPLVLTRLSREDQYLSEGLFACARAQRGMECRRHPIGLAREPHPRAVF